MYILTNIWMLRTRNAGQNSHFKFFLLKSIWPAFWCKLRKFFVKFCCKFLTNLHFLCFLAQKTLKMINYTNIILFIISKYLHTCCVSWPALGCLSSVYLHRLLGASVSTLISYHDTKLGIETFSASGAFYCSGLFNFRCFAYCAVACFSNPYCSAFRHEEDDLSCGLGLKDKVVVASFDTPDPVTISVQSPIISGGTLLSYNMISYFHTCYTI